MTLIFSVDLINWWWLKLRANELIITLVFDTRWRNQNRGVFFEGGMGGGGISFSFFVLENVEGLKFNTILFEEGNNQ